jgi:hypothetical protein
MAPSPLRPLRRWLVLVVVVAAVLVGPGVGASDGWELRGEEHVAEGMKLSERVRADPVRSLAIEIAPAAPARIGVVVSGDRVDGAREPVSSMCARSGAVACVNAHFATCPSCGQPAGSIVRDGVIVRTRSDDHFGDVAVVGGRLSSDPWPWSLALRSSPGLLSLTGPAEIGIQGVNTAPVADGIVAYTPDFGPRTPVAPERYEVVIRAPEPLRTGPDVRQPIGLVAAHRDGAAAIPPDGMVLSGVGRGADRLARFISEHGSDPLELVSHSPAGLEQSVAGHPVLLRDGQRQPLDGTANRHLTRHPRTVIGWNDAGTVWLVVVDGRQAASRGIGLADVAAHLQGLGATDAVNLDGGGSSTLVTRCPHELRLCVRNSPSGGRERLVTTALAVFGSFVEPPPLPPTVPAPPPAASATPPLDAVPEVEAEVAAASPGPAAPPAPAVPSEAELAAAAPVTVPAVGVTSSAAAPAEAGRSRPAAPGSSAPVAAPLPQPLPDRDAARSALAGFAAALVAAELLALRRLRARR